MVKAFINGMGIISPQQTWGEESFLNAVQDYKSNALTCIEPDYTQWISQQQLRRMSRIIKMGTASAKMALAQASLEKPDGIITGTGFGCLEDTETFLSKITDLHEEALNPTPFMQSTHNTIGSQIALQVQCRGYNQTYTQSAFSLEQSLLDALMVLTENPNQNILTGGVDELTSTSHSIQSRFGKYREDVESTLALLEKPAKGTIAGEGASYFILSGKSTSSSLASVAGVDMYYQLDEAELTERIMFFLKENNLSPDDIDLLLVGKSGDDKNDRHFDYIISSHFAKSSIGAYKHLCGEYAVSSAFAMGLGAAILDKGNIPDGVLLKDEKRFPEKVLIFNSYFQDHHSLILLESCRATKS